ncbi:WbqC family protein [Pelosinus sp. UFO1]|uniref:WbqC family protein n=1 Tax=Pelosinus sp. UFO1 TaxID=484770 RepID=UPI0004D1DFDC|nr:WbqC family protein [Pelosinus sp. UFO1]AIF53639.1 WbqC-like family protein [Pelosinus sp. UFO1]
MLKKIVVIHQPDFLSYLGFFDRLLKCDLYVILDHVQYLRGSRSWMNRDKIKTPQGEKWLTIAVEKAPRDTPINQIMLEKSDEWRINNLNLLRENYRKACFFTEIFPYVEEMYSFKCERMMDFNIKALEILLELLDIKVEMMLSSTLNVQNKSNEMLVDILQKVHATRYLSGIGARDYYDPEPFISAKIEVSWQDFNHPIYPQLYGAFIPYLSTIDMLFNCGITQSRDIIRSC